MAAIAVVTLAVTAGCAPSRPWAENAVEWVAARDRAALRSVSDLMLFESPDTVHLLCCNQIAPIRGRAENADFLSLTFGDAAEEMTLGRWYIDVSGAVMEYRLPASPQDDRPVGSGHPVDPNELQISEHAADGTATRTVHATSLTFLTAPIYDGRGWYGDELSRARGLTQRYLHAWSGRDAPAVTQLYAPSATLQDSLLGLRLTGRDAIASYAAEHGGGRLQLDAIPHDGGPALYGFWSGYQSHLAAYLTYTGDDGNGCPGGVAVQLQIEQGQIMSERRYHDVPSMRRCADTAQLPDGWWTHAVIPGPIQDRVTGIVAVAGRLVEVHNGTAAADDLVRWGIGRFAVANLAAPEVSVIAFSEEIHRAECSSGRWGVTHQEGSSSRIYLCFSVEVAATPSQREMVLHELAHAWMWQNLDEQAQRSFLTQMHLATWDAAPVPWNKRGVEHAADVIAWGLVTEPLRDELLSGRSCTELATAFRLLTNAVPLQPQCPAPQH